MENVSRQVEPKIAALVLIVFAVLLVGWSWCRDRMVNAPLAAHMAADTDGSVLVAFEHRLFRVDANGRVEPGAQLPQMSIRVGPAPRGDGRVYVYFGGDSRVGLIDNLLAWARRDRPTTKATQDEGLYLCAWQSGQCTRFVAPFVFTTTAHLWWDAARQHLLVADTGRHRLNVFDASGKELKTLTAFKYPNGMWQHDNALLIADTNHHRIAALDLDGLTVPRTQFTVDAARSYTWPTAIIRVGVAYWLVIANNSLDDGRIYRYTVDGGLLDRVAPTLANVVNIVPLGNGALVADMATHSLWLYDMNGKAKNEMWLPGMRTAQAQYYFWQHMTWLLIGIFFVLFAAGFAFAIRQEMIVRRK